MQMKYEYGVGLIISVPPTESQLATKFVRFAIKEIEKQYEEPDVSDFVKILECILNDKQRVQ